MLNSLCLAALLAASGMAEAKDALPFDGATWARLQNSTQHPLAIVFTTSDCEYCPAVIDGLARQIRRAGSKAKLAVVVMDAPAQDASALSIRHYARADRLYAFATGDAERLRYTIDPDWRGVTPYVVLIDRAGAAHRFIGTPPADELKRWLIP